MPDTGDFDREHDRRGDTIGWGDTFAALPLESPAANGWQRVQARLPVPTPASRTRWPLWLATAATLALVAVMPLRMLPQAEPVTHAGKSPVATAANPPSVAATTPTAPTAIAGDAQPVPAPGASRHEPRRAIRSAPSQPPIRTMAPAADASRMAATDGAAAAPPIDLEPLYTQSAQLEGLLAMTRDDRVASGTSAALSDALDGRVAAIDATLIQPGLTDAQRSDLWGQRVDALQQLVGIETTNRLYAARGRSYDAALVSID
ncbi:MAG TPA: hypothetical protein VN205_11235 [Thermomonas sp.]|nr:hypothetical protein [Thermomonas sp.]